MKKPTTDPANIAEASKTQRGKFGDEIFIWSGSITWTISGQQWLGADPENERVDASALHLA